MRAIRMQSFYKLILQNNINEYLKIDPDKLDYLGQSLYEMKNIIDTVDTNLVAPSEDHVAFEIFDFIMHNEYTKYQSDLEKEIYGDDEYDKGYKNVRHMSLKFKDIFDYDHAKIRISMFLNSESDITPALNKTQDYNPDQSSPQSNFDPDLDPITFQSSRTKSKKQPIIKSHDLEYTTIPNANSSKATKSDQIISNFTTRYNSEVERSLNKLQKDFVQLDQYKEHVIPEMRVNVEDGEDEEEDDEEDLDEEDDESDGRDLGYRMTPDVDIVVKER